MRLTRRFAAIIILLPLLSKAQNYTGPVNYVRTWDALKPESNTNNITMAAAVQDFRMTTQYLDGLGRLIQVVTKQGSYPTGSSARDMINMITYDEFGREVYKFLPSQANSTAGNTSVDDGMFKLNPFVQQAAFYGNSFNNSPVAGQGENYYYGQANFEASPLNRVTETFAPGNSWVGTTGEAVEANRRSVKTKYFTNTALDSVRIWGVTNAGAIGSWGSYTTTAMYPAGELYKTITIDEDNKQVIEFKDKQGRVILKKIPIDTQTDDGTGKGHYHWICTYYIYDDLGNLRCVVQPVGVRLLNLSYNWVLNGTLLGGQCFRYEYDERNRMIMKKVPGAADVYMVHDALDRLVMTQDGNMRNDNRWMVTKYDGLNRPVETGLWTSTSSFATHRVAAYSSISYPATTSDYDQLTLTHYDDYTSLPGGLTSTLDNTGSSELYSSYNTSPVYAQALTVTAQTRGLVTWTATRVLETPDFIYSVNLYDEKGRLIQTKTKNNTGGTDIFTTQYNWAGQPIKTVNKTEKAGTNAQTITVVNRMSYDELARLYKVDKKIGHSGINSGALSANWVTILEQSYDAIGQVSKKTIGNKKDPSTNAYYTPRQPLQELVYDYNIRGWMLGMNRGYLATQGQTSDGKLFGFELGYDKNTNKAGRNYAATQYNGNITGMIWKSNGDGQRRKYDFTYDPAHRLKTANFEQHNTDLSWNNSLVNYNVQMGGDPLIDEGAPMDENGNIRRMRQWGFKLGGSIRIDNLYQDYYPGTNILRAVQDNQATPDSKLGDFADKNAGQLTDYGYDKNGNMVTDLNKGINGTTGRDVTSGGGIQYNHLNLPQLITVKTDDGSATKGTIAYAYDARGVKLKKITTENSVSVTFSGTAYTTNITTTTTYLNGAVFESKQYSDGTVNTGLGYIDRLQFLGQEEGRIRAVNDPANPNTLTALEYDYLIKDHLGNVRMVLTEEQKTDLYPIASLEDAKLSTEENYYEIDPGKIVLASSLGQPPPAYLNDNGVGNNPPDPSFESSNSQKLYQLKGDENKMGLGITLRVMAGDKLNIMGKSYWYQNTVGAGPNVAPAVLSLLEGLLGSPSGGAVGAHTTATELNGIGGVTSGVSAFLNRADRNYGAYPDRPKAFINYIFFDEQFHYVDGDISAVGNGPGLQTHNMIGVVAPKNGYVYIYCSNESAVPVFFDNLQVGHIRGALLEETHYYPFGLTMAGISSKALNGAPENKYKANAGTEYSSKEFSDGGGLDWYDTDFRRYNAQIGRFTGIDALSAYATNQSPYSFVQNNPISFVDPQGLDTVRINGEGTHKIKIRQGDVLAWKTGETTSYYTYDPSNSDAVNGFVGQGRDEGEMTGVTVSNTRQKDNSSPGYQLFTRDQNFWMADASFALAETSKATFRLTNGVNNGNVLSPKLYRPSPITGRGWGGGSRAGIRTFKVANLAKGASVGLTGIGIGMDAIGVYKYYKGENDPNAFFQPVHPGQAAINTGIAAYGFYFNPVFGLIYFGTEAFYPGGVKGAVKDQAKTLEKLNDQCGCDASAFLY